MNDKTMIGMIVCFLILLIIAVETEKENVREKFRIEAIEAGVGKYNGQTGEFEFVEGRK